MVGVGAHVAGEVDDAGPLATERASRVGLDLDLAEDRGQPVIDDQVARQALADPQQLLQHLGRL